MRKMLIMTSGILLAACTAPSNVPPVVSWSYGAGNGDPIPYQGPAPVYSRAYGLGADVPVSMGGKPTVQYGYGADSQTGVMVQTQPNATPSTRMAAPAAAAPGQHS